MIKPTEMLRASAVAPRWEVPWRKLGGGMLELLGAVAILLTIWLIAATLAGKDLPGPLATMRVFWDLVTNPFYDRGPNDKGIALQLASSLQRVFLGFGLGALVAIPLGFLMGASPLWNRVLNPIV